MAFLILSINPGSTSTKIAVYEDGDQIFFKTIDHTPEELGKFDTLLDQFDLRKDWVIQSLEEQDIDKSRLSAVVGRGGMLPPVHGGAYLVNEAMIEELRSDRVMPHASNLGALIAFSIAEPLGIPAYIYDAVTSDELYDVAKITGIPEITRHSFCHVLNSKASARKVAKMQGSRYEEKNYIVAHIGGGISVSAHEKGRIVDVITDDAGPFSPERAGSVPLGYIINICYHSGLTEKELNDKLKKNSGIMGHLHTNDCREVEKRIAAGDEFAARIYEAQAYQIAKGIGEMAPPLCGKIDGVILTGGMARSEYITRELSRRVSYLGEVFVIPGENEMESLALGALRILRGEENCSTYTTR
ncbi:butyrate kinase [Treponema primitia]|uniref:butyrate kinase n=1 Tax=Treponema primitia TaxID=88058 RepID=UPI0002555689|nr:butyrate kinase [Treponema primitia]